MSEGDSETKYSLVPRVADPESIEVHGPGMFHPTCGWFSLPAAVFDSHWRRQSLLRLLQRAYEAGKAARSAEIMTLLKGPT